MINFGASLASISPVKSPKTLVILLLTATTIGGAALAWRQYAELVELRALALSPNLQADMERRVAELEKLNRELNDQLAAQRASGVVDELVAGAPSERPAGERASGERGRGGRGDPRGGRPDFGQQQATALRELMSKPEVQAMLGVQQKAAIESRYAALFKNLNLQPDQVERLKTLLADRTTTMQDVISAARDQGINPRENPEAYRKLIADAQNQINSSIKSVIGDAGFAQLQTYEQTMPQRNLVNELQQRLSYTNSPLTSAQAEQLVTILATHAPARTTTMTPASTSATSQPQSDQVQVPGRGPGGPGFPGRGDFNFVVGPGGPGGGIVSEGGRGGMSAPVTPAAVAQAQGILTPPQLAALTQVQQQQQTQQQLQQLIRDTMAANGPAPQAGATKTGTSPPTRKRPGG